MFKARKFDFKFNIFLDYFIVDVTPLLQSLNKQYLAKFSVSSIRLKTEIYKQNEVFFGKYFCNKKYK